MAAQSGTTTTARVSVKGSEPCVSQSSIDFSTLLPQTTQDLPWHLKKGAQRVYVKSGDYIVLDLEAVGLDPFDEASKLVLACWIKVANHRVVARKHTFGSIYEMGELVSDLAEAKFVVAHGAKYEVQWLIRMGVDPRKVLPACTMNAQWVLNGNLKRPLNLDDVAKQRGIHGKEPVVKELIKLGVPVDEIPPEWLLEYCWHDVDATYEIFKQQVRELADQNMLHIWHTRNISCACLAAIEQAGMKLDAEAVRLEVGAAKKTAAKLQHELSKLAEGVNFRSKQQLAEFLYEKLKFKEVTDHNGKPIRTEGGAKSTSEKVLVKLVAQNQKQEKFLDTYRKYNNAVQAISKYLTFFEGVCDEQNGIFRAVFNQGIAATHRLTSSGRPILLQSESGKLKPKSVQFQNLPRGYKRLFKAREEGHLIGECDGAQLEFRVAADLGRDRVAYAEIAQGVDIHSITRDFLTAHDYPVTRQGAKEFSFKPLYGGSRGHPAVVAYCEFFREKYKGIAATQHRWELLALDKKEVALPYGMRYKFPFAKPDKRGYVKERTQIYNYPVQGFATGEIIPIALVYFWHRTAKLPINAINTVHDSIVAEFHEDYKEVFEKLALLCMTHDVAQYLRDIYNYDFKVPLGAGVKVATHWGQTSTEVKYNVIDPLSPHNTVIREVETK